MKFGEKIVKTGVLVFVFFAIKMALYYIAVDISIISGFSWLVTLVFFGLSLVLYKHGTERARLGFRIFYLIFTLILFIDVIYYNYFNQLVSVNQIWQIKNMKGTGDSVKAAIPLVSLLLWIDLPILFFIRRKYKIEPKSDNPLSAAKKRWLSVGLVVSIVLIVLNPFRIAALQKLNSTEAVSVHIKDVVDSTVGKVIYDHSSLGEILQRKEIPSHVVEDVREDVVDEDEPAVSMQNRKKYAGIGQGMNLIVIQLESVQNFVINREYEGQEITPFLNELLKEDTLYFNHFYTNMGKGNTSDAEFSMQTSLYPVIEGASYDLYTENNFLALPQLMKDQGYRTSAAIGDDKDFYNRNTVYEALGYDWFYNEENLQTDEIFGLGLSDKSFFRQMAENLKAQDGLFYSFMITLTNHYPYVLEDAAQTELELAKDDEDTLFGGYMQTVRYTDEALAELVQALKDNGLYENTIIMMYGDHHGLNCLDEDNYERMTEYLGYAYDYDTMLNVPFLIHIPGLGEAKTIETVGGQVDILPTIANLYRLDLTKSVTFGQDLLNAEEGFLATVAYMLQGSFIKDGVLYEIGRDGSFENGRALDLETHEVLPLDGLEEYSKKAVAMTEMSKYILEHNEAVTTDEELKKTLETVSEEIETLNQES